MKHAPAVTIQAVTAGMRALLYVAAGLVFVAGVQLFILGEWTDRFFAWTIAPPLTAAFLGAAYWASCCLELLAAREWEWARARVAVSAVLAFTGLTLVATIIHRARFHFNDPNLVARTAAWLWLAVYAVVPIALTILLIIQFRAPGVSRPRVAPISPWLLFPIAAQAVIMLGLGVALFLAPTTIAPLWPWTLTALTGRAVGAWLIGLGIAAAQISWENDWVRARPAAASYAVFALLQCVVLARYPGEFDWGDPRTWVYLSFLASMLVVSVGGWREARHAWRA